MVSIQVKEEWRGRQAYLGVGAAGRVGEVSGRGAAGAGAGAGRAGRGGLVLAHFRFRFEVMFLKLETDLG